MQGTQQVFENWALCGVKEFKDWLNRIGKLDILGNIEKIRELGEIKKIHENKKNRKYAILGI